jgi:hypothetical protein
MRGRTLASRFDTNLIGAALAVALAFGVIGTVNAADPLPAYSIEGLKLVPNTKVSALYLREGADFSSYDKVTLLDCYVAFKKNWKRDHNSASSMKVSDEDMTRIKNYLAEEFKKVFTARLTTKGEQVVAAPAPGALVLRSAIINLDVVAPDAHNQIGRTFTSAASAGQATLYLELFDSVTGELLARALDVESAGARGYIGMRNGVTNRSDANVMLKKWADLFATFLKDARVATSVPVN